MYINNLNLISAYAVDYSINVLPVENTGFLINSERVKMSDVLTSSTDDDNEVNDLNFEYETSLEDAVQPLDLPDGQYWATVEKAIKRKSNTSGRDQLVLTHKINPEDYPKDYPVEHNPDGVEISSYSADVGPNTRGVWNMRQICLAYKVPLGSKITPHDFIGKRVLITLENRKGNDGRMSSWLKGLPTKVAN